jgi:periplasmic divalent cation tolerance protein
LRRAATRTVGRPDGRGPRQRRFDIRLQCLHLAFARLSRSLLKALFAADSAMPSVSVCDIMQQPARVSTNCLFVYVTAPTHEVALRIAHRAVEERLAACVNVGSPVTSVYRWEGKLETTSEVPLVLKTIENCAARLQQLVLAEHPYQCPCIEFLPVVGGHADYLRWVNQEVGGPPGTGT